MFLLNCCLLLLLLVQLLFITQTIFDFRGAVREPWDMTVWSCFTFRGYLFSACFLALIFSTKNHICRQLDPKNDSQIHPKPGPGPIFFDFLHSLFLLPCAMFLMVFTVPTCSKTHKKLHKNTALKTQWENMMISCKKQEIFRKRLPTGVPKSESKLGKCHFGASGGTSGASAHFFTKKCGQSAPKVVPSLQKWLQKWVQSGKSGCQVTDKS